MSEQEPPRAVFFAGTNGAGKSTLRDISPDYCALETIDADAIAREINPSDPRAVDLLAGRLAALKFRDCITYRKSFSLETTLTGKTVLVRMGKAKEAGFRVELNYVGLKSADMNVLRVADRVAKGGHHIDEADIRRRYDESLSNLPKAMALADFGKIFSNSGYAHELACQFNDGRLRMHELKNPEPWIVRAVQAQTRHVEVGPKKG